MSEVPAAEPVWYASLSEVERTELSAGRGEIGHKRPDVLVVGGGIVGLATAWFLTERGAKVQVIDSQSLAAGATGTNAGGIWPNDQGPGYSPAFQTLAFLGRDLWGRLSLRPQFDFDWRVNGLLNLNPAAVGESAPTTAARLQERGFAAQPVDGEQIAALEPNLRGGLTSGLHHPSEAHLHPVKAALSLARGARKKGTSIGVEIAARAIKLHNGRIMAVETTAGTIEPRHVVSATGWSAAWLHPAIAPLPPLRPVSGQLIATDPAPQLLNGAVVGVFLILQLRTGEIVTGANVAESDRLVPDPALSRQFADAAGDLIPALRGVPFTRAWCGIRPGTPDGMPIIDQSAATENLWLACGHFKNGVLLAPPTGKLLADWIADGNKPAELEPFCADRFR